MKSPMSTAPSLPGRRKAVAVEIAPAPPVGAGPSAGPAYGTQPDDFEFRDRGEAATPFSVQLWRYRTDRCLTQEELAERAGLSSRGIRALEQGERQRPYKHTVRLLADALDLNETERRSFEAAARAVTPGATRAIIPQLESELIPGAHLPVPHASLIEREQVPAAADLLADENIRLLLLRLAGNPGGRQIPAAGVSARTPFQGRRRGTPIPVCLRQRRVMCWRWPTVRG